MRKHVKTLVILGAMVLGWAQSGVAAPVDESGISKSVDLIAVQGTVGYFNFREGFQQPPLYNVCYMDLNTTAGRVAYATLLALKTSDQKVTRIVYDTASDGTCHVQLLQTQ